MRPDGVGHVEGTRPSNYLLAMRGTDLRVGLRDGVHIASPDCEFRRDHPGSSTHTQLFVQEYDASRLAPAIAAIGITVLLSPQC